MINHQSVLNCSTTNFQHLFLENFRGFFFYIFQGFLAGFFLMHFLTCLCTPLPGTIFLAFFLTSEKQIFQKLIKMKKKIERITICLCRDVVVFLRPGKMTENLGTHFWGTMHPASGDTAGIVHLCVFGFCMLSTSVEMKIMFMVSQNDDPMHVKLEEHNFCKYKKPLQIKYLCKKTA